MAEQVDTREELGAFLSYMETELSPDLGAEEYDDLPIEVAIPILGFQVVFWKVVAKHLLEDKPPFQTAINIVSEYREDLYNHEHLTRKGSTRKCNS